MAKPNNNQPNYFKQNIQKYGKDFIDKMNARDMQVNTVRVFRDLARGNINPKTEGEYFLNPQFMDACLVAAHSKLVMHSTHYNGVSMLIQNMGPSATQEMYQVADYDKRCMDAYTTIMSGLQAIQATGNVEYLYTMANNLRNYRNNI